MTLRKQYALGGVYALAISAFAWAYADPSGFGVFHFGSLGALILAKVLLTLAIAPKTGA